MPAVAELPAKSRRRKPVVAQPEFALSAALTTPETDGLPDANVTPDVPPIKRLQALLDKLQALYLEPNPARLPAELRTLATWAARVAQKHGVRHGLKGPRFPSAKELNELMSCIEEVAKDIQIKKTSIPYLYGVIRRIHHRYPKTGLEDFVAKLLKKITALPIPISTRIKQALANCGSGDTTKVQALRQIQELLKDRGWEPAAKEEQWRRLYPVLMEFTSTQFKQLVQKAKPITLQPVEVRSCETAFQGVLGFAAFHDLLRQHLVWLLDYEGKVAPVAQFIYAFQHEEWDRELRRFLHGSATTPEQFQQHTRRLLYNKRRKKWRSKKQSVPKSVGKRQGMVLNPSKKRAQGR